MAIPAQRTREHLTGELRRLHAMRAATQAELVSRLSTLDAIDRRITEALDELADVVRT